jgi:hypothetical protein
MAPTRSSAATATAAVALALFALVLSPALAAAQNTATLSVLPTGGAATGAAKCGAAWKQCGGNGFAGSTCCMPGHGCAFQSDWCEHTVARYPAPITAKTPSTVPPRERGALTTETLQHVTPSSVKRDPAERERGRRPAPPCPPLPPARTVRPRLRSD